MTDNVTVPLKSKLPVASRFSRDDNRVSRYEILVSRDATLVSREENLVSRESLKRKFWNINEFLARRKTTEFLAHLSRDTFICARANSG